MSKLKKGYAFSFLIHSLIIAPFLLSSKLISHKKDVQKLDIGFSFNLKPLGNTLEKQNIRNSRPFRKSRERDLQSSGRISEERKQDNNKQYGVDDGVEGVDDFYISENYRTVMGKIANLLLYPSIARNNGWEGKVVISFIVNTDGNIMDIRIKKSSGYAILDSSAIRTVESIHGLPVPENPTRITLPIVFSLE